MYCTDEKRDTWIEIEGLAKAKINLLSDNKLQNIPILGYLHDSRIYYCECANCVHNLNTQECECNESQRSWVHDDALGICLFCCF